MATNAQPPALRAFIVTFISDSLNTRKKEASVVSCFWSHFFSLPTRIGIKISSVANQIPNPEHSVDGSNESTLVKNAILVQKKVFMDAKI